MSGRTKLLAFALALLLLDAGMPFGERPAEANHPVTQRTCLDVEPELQDNPVGSTHEVTAHLGTLAASADGLCDTEAPPNRVGLGAVRISFEVDGPNDPRNDEDTPGTPDLFCGIGERETSCSVSYAGSAVGTDTIRGWIDDSPGGPSPEADPEADQAERRDEQSQPGAVPEPDWTDVVTKTWTAAAPALLDCDDETGPDTESETNPHLAGSASNEQYFCLLTDQFGNRAQSGVIVKGEVDQGVNDPEVDRGESARATYDDPDYRTCTTRDDNPATGANEQGTCTVTVTQANAEEGTASICFWVGSATAGQTLCANEGTYENANADGSDTRNDLADRVEKTWSAAAPTPTPTPTPTPPPATPTPPPATPTPEPTPTPTPTPTPPGGNIQVIPEGATHSGFSTFVLLANPTSQELEADLTFLTPNGPMKPVAAQNLTVEPGRRRTVSVNRMVGPGFDVGTKVESNGPLVAEVSVHRVGSLATLDMVGTATPSLRWVMAEGATHSGFTTFITIANPNESTPSTVDVEFMTPTGTVEGPDITVPAGGRRTINVNRACACSTDVSTTVDVITGPHVVAAVSLHKLAGDLAIGGSVGVADTTTFWVVAEGATHSGWTTFVLIANPTDQDAVVDIFYATRSAGLVDGPQDLEVPARSRRTVNVSRHVPSDDVSTLVSAHLGANFGEVTVEGSIQKTDATGFVIANSVGSPGVGAPSASGRRWLAAEGATHSGFTTFVLITNPRGGSNADVKVTFLTKSGGARPGPEFTVPARNRATVNVNKACACSDDVSTLVEVTNESGVVVELAVDRVSPQGFSKGRSIAFKLE